jgi:hypothetical protein
MGGLLYKDFVSVGGKKLVWIYIFLTIIYMILRMAFPGSAEYPELMAETEAGESVNLLDSIFVFLPCFFIIAAIYLLNSFVGKIVDGDNKNKIRGYLSALPLEKNTYVASKYIFIGIAAYVLLSAALIWNIICMAFCAEGIFLDLLEVMNAFIVPLICLALLSAAIELPMFILMGTQKAKLMKITIWLLIGLIMVGFLLFGNLQWLNEQFNITVFLDWYQTHTTETVLISVSFPVITLACCYFSYRITCYFSGKETINYE